MKDVFLTVVLAVARAPVATIYWPAAKILGVPFVDLDSAVLGVNEKLGLH